MKIVVHDGLRNPQTLSVSRVVIYDSYDNPIGFAMELSPNGPIHAEVLNADNEVKFNNMLHELGIKRTVHVSSVQLKNIKDIEFGS